MMLDLSKEPPVVITALNVSNLHAFLMDGVVLNTNRYKGLGRPKTGDYESWKQIGFEGGGKFLYTDITKKEWDNMESPLKIGLIRDYGSKLHPKNKIKSLQTT